MKSSIQPKSYYKIDINIKKKDVFGPQKTVDLGDYL